MNLNPEPHPLDELLEDARMAASSEWEEDFVRAATAAREKYGLRWKLTDRQEAKLRQIAGEEWLEDGYDR